MTTNTTASSPAAGWRWVPVEPTQEMKKAALREFLLSRIWSAMLDAAPSPPAGTGAAEAVAWRVKLAGDRWVLTDNERFAVAMAQAENLEIQALYATPPAPSPQPVAVALADEQVRALMQVAHKWAGPDHADSRTDELELALRSVRVQPVAQG